MSTPAETSPVRARALAWWAQPYLHLALSILFAAGAQIFMKLGADHVIGSETIFGFRGLRSGWTWLGILCHISSLLSWLYALRSAPLNIAYNLAGFIQVLIPLGSWLFLGEHIHAQRWLGIGLICLGVLITARQAGQAEEKL